MDPRKLKPGTTYRQPSVARPGTFNSMIYTGTKDRGRGDVAPEWNYKFVLTDGRGDFWLTTTSVRELVAATESDKTAPALLRWAEIQALLAEGLDYPDGAVEMPRAEHLVIGDIIRVWEGPTARWGQIVGATYDRRQTNWTVAMLRPTDTVTSGATGEVTEVATLHMARVEILAVDY